MKRLFAAILVLVMVFALSAASFADNAVKPLTLKYAHNKNEESYTHKAALVFQEKCAELSDGAIKVEIYANSQLGDETEVRDGLIMGTVNMGSVATGNMASIAHESIEDLGLAEGATAVAIIKATDVLVGIE